MPPKGGASKPGSSGRHRAKQGKIRQGGANASDRKQQQKDLQNKLSGQRGQSTGGGKARKPSGK